MYQYRHILTRMRQGDSDREIARSKTMGRKKIAQVRELASTRGWLAPDFALPDDAVLASALARKEPLPSTCISTLEPWRAQIGNWYAAGIQGTTIHATLVRNHGYTGSYLAVYRFLHQLVVDEVADVPLRLEFKPGEAVQVDFGAGPPITDVHTGEIFKTWFFVMTLAWSRHQYAEFVRDHVAQGQGPSRYPRAVRLQLLLGAVPPGRPGTMAQGERHSGDDVPRTRAGRHPRAVQAPGRAQDCARPHAAGGTGMAPEGHKMVHGGGRTGGTSMRGHGARHVRR